jgi:hypothetical protein
MTTTDTRLSTFGGRDEIKELGFRLQKMMPSAQSFTADEALAVAQIAHAHALDPFNGEVWGIKRQDTGQWYGVMVGIKGLRKCAHRAAAEENSSYWLDFVPADPKKYQATQEGAIVYECHLRDAANMQAYGQAVHSLTDSGIPYKEALEMVGPAPVVVGIGIAWPAERSKMGLHQRAKKRAEADALKTRYDVDFGSGVKFTVEDQEDVINTEAQDIPEITPDAFDQGVEKDFPKQSVGQNLSELGFGDTASKTVQRPVTTEAPKPSKRETEKPSGPVGILMDLGVDNTSHAAALATKLKLTSQMSAEAIEELYSKYENLKSSGKSSDEAAQELVG